MTRDTMPQPKPAYDDEYNDDDDDVFDGAHLISYLLVSVVSFALGVGAVGMFEWSTRYCFAC